VIPFTLIQGLCSHASPTIPLTPSLSFLSLSSSFSRLPRPYRNFTTPVDESGPIYQPILPVGNSHLDTPLLVWTFFIFGRWLICDAGNSFWSWDGGRWWWYVERKSWSRVVAILRSLSEKMKVLRSAFLLKITQITSIKCAVWKICTPVLDQYFQFDGRSFRPDFKPGEESWLGRWSKGRMCDGACVLSWLLWKNWPCNLYAYEYLGW